MRSAVPMSLKPLSGLPLFSVGMNVAGEIAAALARDGETLQAGDIVVIAQKIVSKAEGRSVRLRDVSPSARAEALATETGRPAALMQLILDESQALLRVTPNVIVTRHRAGGHVAANAGIDASNVEGGHEDVVLLWPSDPDASARAISEELKQITGISPGLIIADSLGRAWRLGTQGTAIGSAGILVLDDRRGETDLFGRTLQATIVGVADSIAAAAVLAMGEGAEGAPAVLVRGCERYVSKGAKQDATASIRPLAEDLFQ